MLELLLLQLAAHFQQLNLHALFRELLEWMQGPRGTWTISTPFYPLTPASASASFANTLSLWLVNPLEYLNLINSQKLSQLSPTSWVQQRHHLALSQLQLIT